MIRYLFNKIILNIFHNFIPDKIISDKEPCIDKDSSWFNNEIWQILNKKNELFKQFMNNGQLQSDFDQFKCIRSGLVASIIPSREIFYLDVSAKLSNPSTAGKTYWSILKIFVNGKKVPLITPLFVNGKFVTNSSEKKFFLSDFFSQQYQPISSIAFCC